MKVSVTERGVYRRCRRQWDLSSLNRKGLEPISIRAPFALGTLVHGTIEDWLNADNPVQAQDLFMDRANVMLKQIMENYQERVHSAMSLEEYEPYQELVRIGSAMMANYQTKYGSPLPEGFELIAPEQKVLIPIPNTLHAEVNTTTGEVFEDSHYLEATFDGLIRRVDDDAIFILEHKTYEQRPKEEVLKTNDQFLAYTWAATQMNIGNVVGVAYDGMWKRAVPPRGRVFDDLFCRLLVMRPYQELAEFENNLRMEVMEMANPGLSIYPNRQWMGCWDCQMNQLCTSMSRGEDVEYMLQRFYKKREQPMELAEEVNFG